jgi:hypothetical protein
MTSAIGMPNSKSVVKALPSQMMVDANGNVGIGTNAPSRILQVNGDAVFGNINHPYYKQAFNAYHGGVAFATDTILYAMDTDLGEGKYAIGYYVRGTEAWERQASITTSQASVSNYGGTNKLMGVSRNTSNYLVVGDPGFSTSGVASSGRVHVFYSSTSWSTNTEVILNAPTPTVNYQFGSSIAVSGSAGYIAIGAKGANSGLTGQLFVARRTGTTSWTVTQITGYTPTSTEEFANDVSINDSGQVIAAITTSTKVLIFRRSSTSTSWPLNQTITLSGLIGSPHSVSLSPHGRQLAIGVNKYNVSEKSEAGCVQIYKGTSTFTQSGTTILTASDAAANAWFGRGSQWSFDGSSTTSTKLIVWAWNPTTMQNSGGKLYIFTSTDNVTWSESEVITGWNTQEATIHSSSIAYPNVNYSIPGPYPLNISHEWPDRNNAIVLGSISIGELVSALRVSASQVSASRFFGVDYYDVLNVPQKSQNFYPGTHRFIPYTNGGINGTYLRIKAWGAGGGGGSGSTQDVYNGGTLITLTGGAGGGSGSYAEITMLLDNIGFIDMSVPNGGDGGTGVATFDVYVPGITGDSPPSLTITVYGLAYIGGSTEHRWSFTITVPSGGGGTGGSTNTSRSGGTAGGTPTSSAASSFPLSVTHTGLAGQSVTTYNTFGTAASATGLRQCTGGGAGGGILSAGTSFVSGRDSGVIAVPAGVQINTDYSRVGVGGTTNAEAGGSGVELIYETGTSSSGGGGGASKDITSPSTNYPDGGHGGTGAGGGGGGASKNWYSGAGGNGGSGLVVISWW